MKIGNRQIGGFVITSEYSIVQMMPYLEEASQLFQTFLEILVLKAHIFLITHDNLYS